ncbi:hypothetical protein D3C81_2265060 [compost metagenome]
MAFVTEQWKVQGEAADEVPLQGSTVDVEILGFESLQQFGGGNALGRARDKAQQGQVPEQPVFGI